LHGSENVSVGALLDMGEPLSELPLAEDVTIHERADVIRQNTAQVMWPSTDEKASPNTPKSVRTCDMPAMV